MKKKEIGIEDMTDEEKEAYEKLHDKFELVPKKEHKKHESDESESLSTKKETPFSHILGIFKQPKYTQLAIISILASFAVYSFLYGFWQIPIIQFGFVRMAEITLLDLVYVILISVMAGLLVTLLKYKVDDKSSATTGGIGGVFAGFVSAICPVCQGITIAALGSTVATIPLDFLVPYLWILQIATISILGLGLYMTSNSIYTKTCIACKVDTKIEHKEKLSGKAPFFYENNIAFSALIILVIMLVLNNFLITAVVASAGTDLSGGSISIKPGFEYGSKVTLKPMPLASGESPRIQGYKTIVKPLPTISELSLSPPSGDVAQDLVNNVVPRGTPWYGQEAGVSFDDPIQAQQLWAKGRAIQLSAEEQKRWERIVNSFTCDYCCGSPQNPTIITRCGCAHSAAAQGMAKWFVKNYGDKYSDEEIYGEMARWYALWYPGPTVKRIAQELEAAAN